MKHKTKHPPSRKVSESSQSGWGQLIRELAKRLLVWGATKILEKR